MNLQDAADRFTAAFASNLTRTVACALAIFVIAKLTMPDSAAKASIAGPNADCGEPGSTAAAICADSSLKAMSAAMGDSLMRAAEYYRYERAASEELKAIVPYLVSMRDYAAGDGGKGLPSIMNTQSAFLNALGEPRQGLAGRWVNALGELTITETSKGFYVELRAAEPARAEWKCAARAQAKRANGALLIAEGDHSRSESAMHGWSIRAKRDGALFRLVEIPPEGQAAETREGLAKRPYCGAGGALSGAYFPAQ